MARINMYGKTRDVANPYAIYVQGDFEVRVLKRINSPLTKINETVVNMRDGLLPLNPVQRMAVLTWVTCTNVPY